jgi:hypothetical protein
MLEEARYVEEEWFISGEAAGVPYATVLQVRKPADPGKFSGVVLFETMHAAGATPMWGNARGLLHRGHGYAMVASQKYALDTHVKASNPERYAALGIDVEEPDTSAADQTDSPFGMPPEIRRQLIVVEAQAESSEAIMSQAAALLKHNPPEGPFAGQDVRHVILGGASQTGGTTLRYIDKAHADALLDDGGHPFDGFMPMSAGGTEPVGACDVPVVQVLGEGDMMGRPLGYRRADTDGPDDFYRLYELTAVSHVPTRGVKDPEQIFPLLADAASPDDVLSQIPSTFLYVAALDNLIRWVVDGTPAPRAPHIETDADGVIVRDEHGNARGGVRLSQLDVPIATYLARKPGAEAFAGMIGYEVPFSREKLSALYGTHERYVELVGESLDRLVAERWIFPEDADDLRTEAALADIP